MIKLKIRVTSKFKKMLNKCQPINLKIIIIIINADVA